MDKNENEKEKTNENKVPINYCNTFRLGYSESEFNIDFGMKGNDDDVRVLTSVAIPIKLMQDLLIGLLIGTSKYEEEYKTKVLTFENEEVEEVEEVEEK